MKSTCEELSKITEIHHVLADDSNNISRSLVELCEDVMDQLILDVSISLNEVCGDLIEALLEVLVFWVVLAHLIGQGGANNIAQDIVERDLIIIVVIGSEASFTIFLALAKATDLLVCCLYLDLLDVSSST